MNREREEREKRKVGEGGGTPSTSLQPRPQSKKGYPGAGCTFWLQLFGLNLILVQNTRVNFLQKKKTEEDVWFATGLEGASSSEAYNLISWITR